MHHTSLHVAIQVNGPTVQFMPWIKLYSSQDEREGEQDREGSAAEILLQLLVIIGMMMRNRGGCRTGRRSQVRHLLISRSSRSHTVIVLTDELVFHPERPAVRTHRQPADHFSPPSLTPSSVFICSLPDSGRDCFHGNWQ